MISLAKSLNMTTMIVTNGSLLSDEFFSAVKVDLDWIGVSVDSVDADTNAKIGRKVCGQDAPDEKFYQQVFDRIHKYGI